MAGLHLRADTVIKADPNTVYSIGVQYASAPCSGTCDLSPSYNNYTVPAAFSITKITFNWNDPGGNNCDGFGHYGANISLRGDSTGVYIGSSNSIYMRCGGSGGPGELDFAGQAIPISFYLDFASFDGGIQGGGAVNISNVQIWGNYLSGGGATQIGLPILFIHGICDTPDSFLPAEMAVKSYLQANAPSAYPISKGQEYVIYYDEQNKYVRLQTPNYPTPTYSAISIPAGPPLSWPSDPIQPSQFFLMALDDPGIAGYQNFLPGRVTGQSIYQKGDELEHVIATIRSMTGAPRVLIVAHSMGGLDTRSYLEGLANPTFGGGVADQYQNDIAAFITLDTPHGGSSIAMEAETNPLLQSIFSLADPGCSSARSIDKSEMFPSGADQNNNGIPSLMPELNYQSGNAKPWPAALATTSIVSQWGIDAAGTSCAVLDGVLCVPGIVFGAPFTDDVVLANEQDLCSNIPCSHSNSSSTFTSVQNQFSSAFATPELQVTLLPTVCGILPTPLHLLECTGDASQTTSLLETIVLASAVVFPNQFEVTPSSISAGLGATGILFNSSAGDSTVWSILEGSNSGSITSSGANASYTAPTNAVAGTSIHVIAINGADPSQFAEATVTLAPSGSLASQSISVAPLPSPVVFGTLPITLDATATSQLPVTFSVSSGPATITKNNILTFTGTGTVVVAADQGGNATYAPAPEVTQSILVTNPGPGKLFNQTDSSSSSRYSNWQGNWYQLGTGYSGLLNSVDIFCDVSDGRGGVVSLTEFADSAYSTMTNQFQLSGINGNPSCGSQMAQIHFANLNIPVWSTRYYRLDTGSNNLYADVNILGTQSEGYSMDENWYYGEGVVFDYYQFYPWILSNFSRKPAIDWPAPATITYGTALSAIQLDASSSVAGTYTYSPIPGTVLSVGTKMLSVTFNPTDTTDYTSATATTQIIVNQAPLTVTAANISVVAGATSTQTVSQLMASYSSPGLTGIQLAATFSNVEVGFTVAGPGFSQNIPLFSNGTYFGNNLLAQVPVGAPTGAFTLTPYLIGPGTSNFSFTPIAGTLTITAPKQSLSINAANITVHAGATPTQYVAQLMASYSAPGLTGLQLEAMFSNVEVGFTVSVAGGSYNIPLFSYGTYYGANLLQQVPAGAPTGTFTLTPYIKGPGASKFTFTETPGSLTIAKP